MDRRERDVWGRISAEDEGCKTEVCIKRTGGSCPFYRSRLAAQGAHLLVVNHALLLADAATGNRVLPEYNYLVLDEAHHIEEATTSAMSFKVTEGDIARLVRETGSSSSGILGHYLTTIRNRLRPSDFALTSQMVERATDLAMRLDIHNRQFFEGVYHFLEEQREGRPMGVYAQQERILPATRTQPDWTDVEVIWDETNDTLGLLLTVLEQIHKGMGELVTQGMEEVEDFQGTLGNVYRRLSEIQSNLNGLVAKAEEGRVYWAEIQPSGSRLSLQAAPLHIGPLMERYLWHEKDQRYTHLSHPHR